MKVVDIFWVDNASFEFPREQSRVAIVEYGRPCEYRESGTNVKTPSCNHGIPTSLQELRHRSNSIQIADDVIDLHSAYYRINGITHRVGSGRRSYYTYVLVEMYEVQDLNRTQTLKAVVAIGTRGVRESCNWCSETM